MGHHLRGAAAVLSIGLLGLTGCHSFQNLTGYSTTAANAAPSGNAPNAAPGVPPGPFDAQDNQPLRPLKPMSGSPAEKAEMFLTAAQNMENSGKLVEAIAYYEQVRQLDPRKSLVCSRHLAVLYDRKEDFDKALDEYAALLRANPKDSATHNDLGYGYYRRGKFDVAEQNLRKAVECDPKNKLAWANLGMALAQLNRYDESLAAFEKSAQKNGNPLTRAQAHCNVAFIQAAQGKWDEARASYTLALELEPTLQKASSALQRIDEEKGPGADRYKNEARRRAREWERLSKVDPEFAKGLPFGAPTGVVGANSRMISIPNEDAPLDRPAPASFAPSRPARTAPAVAPQLPPIPATLEVE